MRRIVVLASILAAACGDPSGPGGPEVDAPRLTRLAIQIASELTDPLGTVVPVVVRGYDQHGADFAVPAGTSLEVRTTEAYFAGTTVAEAAGGGDGLGLRLLLPGIARLTARAPGVASPPADVRVTPLEPVAGRVLPAAGLIPGEVASLTGYALDLADPAQLRVRDRTLDVLSQEPARIRFTVPLVEGVETEGCRAASRVPLDLGGMRVAVSTPRLGYGEVETIDLPPAGYRFLGDPTEGCLGFAGGPSSHYTLFYVDGRPVRESENTFEGAAFPNGGWRVQPLDLHFSDLTNGGPATTIRAMRAVGPASPPPVHVLRTAAKLVGPVPDDHYGFFNEPLQAGQSVSFPAVTPGEYEAGIVLKVYGPNAEVAVAGLRADGASETMVGQSFRFDGVMEAFAKHGVPLLSQAMSPDFPNTSLATRQVLYLFQEDRGGFPGVAVFSSINTPSDVLRGYVLLQFPSLDLAGGGPQVCIR